MRENVSVVIPIYNEEEILFASIKQLEQDLKLRFNNFEIVLTENGSIDNTKNIARQLAAEVSSVNAVIDDGPGDYGKALVNGINAAKFEAITIFELDLLDLKFLDASHEFLDKEYDLIIGSKYLMKKGLDERAFIRKFFTAMYNFLLRINFNFRLSETHGLKTLKKSKLDHITNHCVTSHAVWPSEFVIRASRDRDLRLIEIPLTMPLREIRTTRIKAMKRLKKTLEDLMLLRKALQS